MNLLSGNFYTVLPEIIILTFACLALLADLFLKDRWQNVALIFASFGLISAGIASGLVFGNQALISFSGSFISDDLACLMKIFVCISVLLTFIYAKNYIEEQVIPTGEFYVLGLFSTLGMMILISAFSLITIYLG